MRRIIVFLAISVVACSSNPPLATDSATELSWNSVPLKGMHLRLVSPKAKGQSEDLQFGDGNLAVSACSNDICTAPLTIWKIEGNRLKTGFVATEGDVLLQYTGDRIVMRAPDGKILVYSIIQD